MLLGIKLNDGTEIECQGILKDSAQRCLFIHTNSLTPIEAYTKFSDSNLLESIIAVKNDKEVKIYNKYTELFGVQKSDLGDDPNEIMIILKRPEVYDVALK